MKYDLDHISNTELESLIDTWVHGDRDRKIMKRRLIDRICFEPLAEEFGISERYTREIFKKNMAVLARNMRYEADKNRIAEIAASVPKDFCQTS